MIDFVPLLMFLLVCLALMGGYPVAFTLAGIALIFAAGGVLSGVFVPQELLAYNSRLFDILRNKTLIAVPLFVFMGVMLERSQIAEELLEHLSRVFGRLPGGLGIAVVIVGALMAASTGIVGATVVTMGLMALPTMLKRHYDPALACGTICATGTLGQIIPPSIALVLLGDVLSNAWQQAQLNLGVYNAQPVSVGDLFMGAIVPGFILVLIYIVYLLFLGITRPALAPAVDIEEPVVWSKTLLAIGPPLMLILIVLGTIITGKATPTEASAIGALTATALAVIRQKLDRDKLAEAVHSTAKVTAMVFAILMGASLFSLVFVLFEGDMLIARFFEFLPGGAFSALLLVMLVIFLLGFILDFIEITFVVVPLVGPALLMMGFDPIWLGIMIAINLQTSFLTPPFGFALFYLRGVAPKSIHTSQIYRGVVPFIVIQLVLLGALALWPELATWLPAAFRSH